MDAAEKALLELCGGSETRYRVLRALFTNPETQFHLRGLAGAAGVDPSNALRLLQRLVDAGLCEQTNAKYRAGADHPLRECLTALFRIAAARAAGGSQAKLDEIKRMTGQQLLERRSLPEIRRKSIERIQTAFANRCRTSGFFPGPRSRRSKKKYYADPVDEKTAVLPKGWKGRLVRL